MNNSFHSHDATFLAILLNIIVLSPSDTRNNHKCAAGSVPRPRIPSSDPPSWLSRLTEYSNPYTSTIITIAAEELVAERELLAEFDIFCHKPRVSVVHVRLTLGSFRVRQSGGDSRRLTYSDKEQLEILIVVREIPVVLSFSEWVSV